MNKSRNRDRDLIDLLGKDIKNWKGLTKFTSSQMTNLTNAVRHFPRLAVQVREGGESDS